MGINARACGVLCGALLTMGLPVPASGAAPSEEPLWVTERIERYGKAPLGQSPDSIWKYEAGGETVYLIPAGRAGQSDQLLSAKGEYICSPGGDIVSARGERRCTGAYTSPTRMRNVWRDPRLGLTHKPEDTTR
jgi:hypothetical protein